MMGYVICMHNRANCNVAKKVGINSSYLEVSSYLPLLALVFMVTFQKN